MVIGVVLPLGPLYGLAWAAQVTGSLDRTHHADIPLHGAAAKQLPQVICKIRTLRGTRTKDVKVRGTSLAKNSGCRRQLGSGNGVRQ